MDTVRVSRSGSSTSSPSFMPDSLSLSCASAPVNGAKGLHLVPDSELATMSYQEYGKVLKSSNCHRTW